LQEFDYLPHVSDKREMLRHFLAAIAYRTQKALRDAPENFGEFRAGRDVRTPTELVRHMTSVLGYARTYFVGGEYRPEPLPTLAAEVERFHNMLMEVSAHLRDSQLVGIQPEQLLQGPFADVMTHAGQLAMLRRLAGIPVPPENFILADITPERLGQNQAMPRSPDREWPESPFGWIPPQQED
jgi:hypothetical protein